MLTPAPFYPDELRREVEARVIGGDLTPGYINQSEEGPVFSTEPAQVLALVIPRSNGPPGPTLSEMKTQLEARVPAVLVIVRGYALSVESLAWGDFLLDHPLLERPFVHGVFDCYEALRAWKWQNERELLIPPMPRDDGWWTSSMGENPNLYLRNFRAASYAEFAAAPRAPLDGVGGLEAPHPLAPRVGDVIYFQVGESNVVNHAAIYVGYGNVYHHPYGHRSRIANLNRLPRSFRVRKWLRRADLLRESLMESTL